jgi:ABC-type cobalamin/Fe3+-siderophores transport system ATPase subunit
MIKDLEIQNYRCFRNLHMSDLGRINILLGDSGSGKSAFLEALFLAAGVSPEIYLRIRQIRGFPTGAEVADRDNYESLWHDLFTDLNQDKTLTIRFTDNRTGVRWLNISYGEAQTLTVPLDKYEQPILGAPKLITFERYANGRTHKSEVRVAKDGLQMDSFEDSYSMVYVFPAIFSAKETAKRFSYLSKRNEEKPVVESVRKLFPMVRELTVETNWGQPVLYASVDSLSEKLPVTVLSGGINKYIAILLSIAVSKNGVVLVDEFDEGFYYKNFKQVAANLIDACADNNVQLFASTHSYEFLEAVMPSTDEREDGFRLLRFSRSANGQSSVKTIKGQHYRAAIQQDFEVR